MKDRTRTNDLRENGDVLLVEVVLGAVKKEFASAVAESRLRQRERFLEANKKCVTHSDLGSAACRLPAGAGVGTVAEMVVEGVEYVIRLASRAGAA